MNIIAGMMIPETNWAPKLAWNSSSFLSAKPASTSRCRPNTLTSSWPVNASSIWPFSAPVCVHCAMNCFCERFAIVLVTSIDSGTVTSAISASNGEIDEHHRQHADHGEQRRQQLAQRLLQGLRDVVDVVGHPAQQLAARLPVEVRQRQPVELVLDLGAQLRTACAARRR